MFLEETEKDSAKPEPLQLEDKTEEELLPVEDEDNEGGLEQTPPIEEPAA